MKIVIINGSPRASKYSNTDKIIRTFTKGLESEGCTFELYSLSSRREWDSAREAFLTNDRIVFALPMYVDSIPSLMLEFLETLPTERQNPAELSFILHGGFGEGYQFRLCERLLQSITKQFGCSYGGCLIKGGSFMFRMMDNEKVEKMMQPYKKMGVSYARNGNFLTPEASKMTGAESYPWLIRQIVGVLLKLVVNKQFNKFAKEWGCTSPLDIKHNI